AGSLIGGPGGGRELDREPRQTAAEPVGGLPGEAAGQREQRRQEDAADDERVQEDGGRHRDPEQLQRALVAYGKGDEDGDHHRRSGGDHASSPGDTLVDGGGRVAPRLPFLVDTADEEDL